MWTLCTSSRVMHGVRLSVDTTYSIGSSTCTETRVLHSGMGVSVIRSGVYS